MTDEQASWENHIRPPGPTEKFESRTCRIYDAQSQPPKDSNNLCPCGRRIDRHSFIGDSLYFKAMSSAGNAQWKPPEEFQDNKTHSTSVKINVFGTLKPSGCKFIRLDARTKVQDLFQLISDDCGRRRPGLILSIYGGAKYFTMTEKLEKEFIRGVIDAATMADGWILTAGIDNGVSKLVGEGISHYRLLRDHSNIVKCIGMTMWSTINEETRRELKEISKEKVDYQRQIPEDLQEDKEAIEQNHTYCILFDSGRLNENLSDSQRNQFVTIACANEDKNHEDKNQTCYAVTIIVDGGFGSLEVLENDIAEKRPIVIIQGSGRLADVLAWLIEKTSNSDQNESWNPSRFEIEKAVDQFYPYHNDSDLSSKINRIEKLLAKTTRHLLHVFSLDRDKNVAETIFKAIFTAQNVQRKKSDIQNKDQNTEKEKQYRQDQDKLVELALEWNYFDGVLPILQARQNDMAKKTSTYIKEDIKRQKDLFQRSLEKNRPIFIEYFLSAGFDPLTLADNKDFHGTILQLYRKSYKAMKLSQKQRVSTLFGSLPLSYIGQIDSRLNRLVGPFLSSLYSANNDHLKNRIQIDLTNHVCTCCRRSKIDEDTHVDENNHHQPTTDYTKQHILRDLFLWSIFLDMPDMAKVLLIHLRSRICASLIASALFKTYSKLASTIDMREKFTKQALDFEIYAAMSLDKCYEYNEKRTCELLLRQIPLWGNATCVQVAISSESAKLLETACFDQTLNLVWFDKLSLTNQQLTAKLAQIPSIGTIGLLAPVLLNYRNEQKDSINGAEDEPLSQEGIDYYMPKPEANESRWKYYGNRLLYFHISPVMKMAFHFLSYIFFLMTFSYMMLYHLDRRDTFVVPHWTEIYVIITLSTMFCEEIRKIYFDYDRRMVERWGSTGSTVLTVLTNSFYILPYILFYVGLGFRYGSYTDQLLSTARIIWALDLELWYLRSLKFVIALKFLGPKLFMLKNMLRDLFAFVYMIFIAIAAYGVVSRALILYQQVPFTGEGIFSNIFYGPYWFIYGTVADKDLLDKIINNGTVAGVAEATATHVLLAFHMLFINILLLNLLIAVFADSIGKVQENTEFYWRYQRYSFVREYFERLPLGYPPLIIIPHVVLFIIFLLGKCSKLRRNQVAHENKIDQRTHVPLYRRAMPIFKMIPVKDSQNEQWDMFENAATNSYARSVLEKSKSKDHFIQNDGGSESPITSNDSGTMLTTTDQRQTTESNKDELMNLLERLHMDVQKGLKTNSGLEIRLDQLTEAFKQRRRSESK